MERTLQSRLADLLLIAVAALTNPHKHGHLVNNEFVKEVDEVLEEHYGITIVDKMPEE